MRASRGRSKRKEMKHDNDVTIDSNQEHHHANQSCPRPPPSLSVQKTNFRSLRARGRRQEETENSPFNSNRKSSNEMKQRRKEERRAREVIFMDRNAAMRGRDHLDESLSDSSRTLPGAVSIPGPRRPEATSSDMEIEQDHQTMIGDDLQVDALNDSESPVQVEAQVVEETPDIDVLVSQRVNKEVQERLDQEKQTAVHAEVVTPSKKRSVGIS